MTVLEQITAEAAFAEPNAFNVISNGVSTILNVALHNTAVEDVQVVSAAASWHDLDRDWRLVKNQTAARINVPLIAGGNLTLPFRVHSEFRPKDLGLTIWADVKHGQDIARVVAFNQTVSIVEPAASLFDPQVIFAYLVVGAALLGGAYLVFVNFIAKPQPKKRRVTTVKPVVVERSSTEPQAAYEDEWIPAIHKTKAQSRRSGASTPLSGGEATSGAESGTEKAARRKKSARK